MTYLEACEAQGARCGHIDGSNRIGKYTQGEEYTIEIADQNLASQEAQTLWEIGYHAGYRAAVRGESLDYEILYAPLPGEVTP